MISRKASILPGRLARKYKSNDPFEIAEALDIEVLERSDFKRQKGAFKVILNNSFIFINANLSDEMKRLVCAHELGHALLHRSLGKSETGLMEFELFDITALKQSRCQTAALTAARSNFRKELPSGQLRRKRFKTCSGQGLKMKNNKYTLAV